MMRLKKIVVTALMGCAFAFAGDITVENPFVKEVAAQMPNSAAFMTIVNKGTKTVSLINARSTASKIVELHTHGHKNGMMAMYRVEKIEVPAGGKAELKPMSFHVMLIDLNKPIKEGDTVDVELVFDNGESVKVSAPVKKFGNMMKPNAGGMK
jgi:periplasmic copper chaperone A